MVELCMASEVVHGRAARAHATHVQCSHTGQPPVAHPEWGGYHWSMAKRGRRDRRTPARQPDRTAAESRAGRRPRRWRAGLALLAAGAAAIGLASVLRRAQPTAWQGAPLAAELESANLILVTIDTLRADHLPAYGYTGVETPEIDRLARESILFENVSAAVPLTLPAHSTIFTSTYPTAHGVRDNGGFYLSSDALTLAEVLRERGLRTGAFVAAFVLDHRWGLDQGFETYWDQFDLTQFERISLDSVQRRGDQVIEQGLGWLAQAPDRRSFLWLHLYDPHTPYDPPEPYRSRYAGKRFGLYDGEIAWVDHLLGRLRQQLERSGIWERSVVIVTADHGESLGQHQESSHGLFLYDAAMRVPLLVRLPDAALGGRRIAAQAASIDIAPTALELLGVPIPEPMSGASLVPRMLGADPPVVPAYSESYYPRFHYGWSELLAVRDGRYKLIEAPRPELYDLRDDPGETRNLAGRLPQQVERLRRALEPFRGADAPAPSAMDEETLRSLQALGYIASGASATPEGPLPDPKDKIGVHNLIKSAEFDSAEGNYDRARKKLEAALARDPQAIEAHQVLGTVLVRSGEHEAAVAEYRKALEGNPDHIGALFGLAALYKQMGRYAEAEAGFLRLRQLDPKDSKSAVHLADLKVLAGDRPAAIEMLRATLPDALFPAVIHNKIGEILMEMKRPAEAEAAFRGALTLDPDLRQAQFNLAVALEETGRLDAAIESYRRELALNPRNLRAHFNLARLLGRAGAGEEQIEHLRQTIEIRPEFANGHIYLAKALVDQGSELEHAVELARHGLTLEPDAHGRALAHYVLADAYTRMDRPEDAEREVRLGRAADPRFAPAAWP